MKYSIPVVIISGPTASGKSALALMFAHQRESEIVSADSAQIYQGMDIGTAKPDAATRSRVPHHLIDIIPPTESYSAARFAQDAVITIDSIRARNRVPIIVGGTMLYIKALLEGLSDLPEANPKLREEINHKANSLGWQTLHEELSRVDPVTAERLKPTDAQRIQRALEVFYLTGKPLSSLQGHRAPLLLGRVIHIALMPENRARLHEAIAQRFDAMLEAGLIEETRQLRARYPLHPDLPSMRCVGYRQTWDFLEGKYDKKNLREKGIAATRQLAKRQLTWLRAIEKDVMIDPFGEEIRKIDISALMK